MGRIFLRMTKSRLVFAHIGVTFCDDLDAGTFTWYSRMYPPPPPTFPASTFLFQFCVRFVTIWTLALLTVFTYTSAHPPPSPTPLLFQLCVRFCDDLDTATFDCIHCLSPISISVLCAVL